MTTFDVHTDKAIKELRARLDQAERERDEARAALAGAYEDAAQIADRYGHAHIADAIRARATSPAPEPHPAGRAATDAAKAARARGEDVYADGEGRCEVVPAAAPVASAERAVVEAAVAWHACLSATRATGSVLCPPGKSCGAALESAVDALAAARKDGAR